MVGRSILTVLALSALTLAGCLDDAQDELSSELPGFLAEGLNTAHPGASFAGFGVAAALPETPDGRMRDVRDDGSVVWYKPAYRGIPDVLTRIEPVASVDGPTTGGGIAVFGPLAFIGGRTQGPLQVVSIIDPANPVVVGVAEDVPVRDADTILFPDGQLVLITTAGGTNIFATDVTDPAKPTLVGQVETVEQGGANHNIAVVPGTPIVYNSNKQIVDFSDPAEPKLLGAFEGGGRCHDIAFSIDRAAGRAWALCAGYEQTQIWDIHDPLAPELVVAIDYPSVDKGLPVVGEQLDDAGVPQDAGGQDVPCTSVPNPAGGSISTPCSTSAAFPLSFSHLAIVNHDASVLIMGDETGGGGINGCDFYAEGADGQTYSGPVGNLWFYDITDPENPDLRGHVSPGAADADGPQGSCTAHFGKTIEDKPYVVMGFYTAGVVLVDYSDLSNPRIMDRWDEDGDIWDVQYYQGYLFTGDMTRGMDVLSLSG